MSFRNDLVVDTQHDCSGTESRSAAAPRNNLPQGWRATWCTEWRQYYYWRVKHSYVTWTPPPACILEAAWAYEASRRKHADVEAKHCQHLVDYVDDD